MSDITHSDYCPEDRGGELEDCPSCTERQERQAAYYYKLYKAETGYEIAEILDAYSDPTERAKRDSLLRGL